MYHQHSQQEGSQPYPNGHRPPHHQPPLNQHQNRSNMHVMGFQFPRPTQLPDELESALAIRGSRDMDHRQIDHMNRPNQQQNQGSGSGISQHGSYGSNPISHPADNPPGHQQGIDWSSYQPPAKLFASLPPNASHQSQQHQGPQQQPQSNQAGTRVPNWAQPVRDSSSTQARHPHGGSMDGQSLYTPESAGSILASFGLSNEDLEVLSHYPDDQLTPDTLPFILRDIQINKSGNHKTVASSSSSSFSRSIHDMPLPPSRSSTLARSCSPEVPSLLAVTQTAGKVIDYGHASRAKDESSTRETFKRELLSSERTVKMYPASSSSSSAPKVDKTERRHLEHTEPSKHGDKDYRRASSDQHKNSRSPGREFAPSPKSRNLDKDYRRDGAKPRPSSEAASEASSRRSLSSSSGSKPHSSSKKLPTPTMISDFSAASPKVYPHTCSLCHIQCDQEKDWVDHINTVSHTAACRDLRNKHPDWNPNPPSWSQQYGSRALWDPKDQSPSQSVSQSRSRSPTPSPPQNRHRVDTQPHRPHGRPYSPTRHPRHIHYTERRHQFEHHHAGSHSQVSHRVFSSSREHWPEKKDRETPGGFSRCRVKRPHADTSRNPSLSTAGHSSKHGPSQPPTKSFKAGMRPGTKMTKMASAKSTKPPPAKKKKKKKLAAKQQNPSQGSSIEQRLVYLTNIPKDASEQEVTDLVGAFGKINNVILMPCSEEESDKGQGQKASVCMLKAENARALATSTNLSIRDQEITATVAKKPEAGRSFTTNNSKTAPGQDKGAAGNYSGGEAHQKTSAKKGTVLITELPESGWSESDIINLIQPFGIPSDVILATQIGKVLVSVPDMEVAQEVVKVHSFLPAKIKDTEVKMIFVKQCIGLSTPVALYNLLMGSVDPLESPAPVGWSSLLVISNVPNTLSGSSEVLKLVRRFGTVIKTLVLDNVVICEMATAAMAFSVYKRFQGFPCIIQSNPLYFSREPDPRPYRKMKIIAAYLDSSKDTPANGKGRQAAAAADKKEIGYRDNSESPLEVMVKNGDEQDKKMKSTKKTVEDEALGENGGKNNDMKKDDLTISDSSAAPDATPETDLVTDTTSAVEIITETTEENNSVSASGAVNDQTPAGEETKLSSFDVKAVSQDTAMPELPKMTEAMVSALLVECRTRTACQTSKAAATPSGELRGAQMEKEWGKKEAEETKEQAKNTEEEEEEQEEEEKKQEREERKERREKKDERAKRERIEKARRERERKEEERKEWERKESTRRERKRGYSEGLPGSRLSFRSEGHKQSSWKDERYNVEAETKTMEEDEFPFNMSDFVTVDEIGDVTDLPTVLMETSEGGEDAPTSIQQDTPGDTPLEATVTLGKSDENISESEHVSMPTAETSDGLPLPDLTPGLVLNAVASSLSASQLDPCLSQHYVAACKPDAPQADITPEPDPTLTATLDSTPEVEPLSMPAPAASADGSLNSSATGGVTAESKEDEKENNPLNPIQTKEEEMVSNKQEEQGDMQVEENKEARDASAETGNEERSEEENAKTKASVSTDQSLPPFDSSNPVGMEFLVPKTGFFCKVCSRFFSGSKEAEINHCKTLKHYENLQKHLQTRTLASVTAKPDSS